MSIKAILFDLDGTLLPQNQNIFIGAYFKGLINALSPLGIDAKTMEAAIWKSTGAMVKNDGSKTNEQAFFESFRAICNADMKLFEALALEFYMTGYKALRKYTEPTALAKEAVKLAASGGRAVVLATNPLFPMIAQKTRMEFAGISDADLSFVTSYESDCYAKPNPSYYTSIADRLGVLPEQCLVVGNDEYEDMYAASCAGMRCYLVEDCVIESVEHPWHGDRGSLAELVQKLRDM